MLRINLQKIILTFILMLMCVSVSFGYDYTMGQSDIVYSERTNQTILIDSTDTIGGFDVTDIPQLDGRCGGYFVISEVASEVQKCWPDLEDDIQQANYYSFRIIRREPGTMTTCIGYVPCAETVWLYTCELSSDPCDYDSDGDGLTDCTDPDNYDGWDGPPPDSDGDGLPDSLDPFPDDARYFQYREVGFYTDENGLVTERVYEFKDADGNTKYMSVGESGEGDEINIVPFSDFSDGQNFIDTFGDGSQSYEDDNPVSSDSTDGYIDPDNLNSNEDNQVLDDGNDSTGNTTELDHLSDIVDNTKKTMDNQQVISDQLTDISNKIGQGNELLSGIGAGQGESNSPSAEEIAEEIVGDAPGDISPDTSELAGELTDAATAFGTENSLLTDAPEEYREKTDISEKITELTEDPTVTGLRAILTGTEVTVSGSPCVNWTYNGESIQMCVDQYDSALHTFGALLLSLVGVHALLIVFRR